MNFKEILKEQFKDLVTEDTLTTVYEAFEAAVNEKAERQNKEQIGLLNERIQLEVDAALMKVDEDHSEKLEQLVEAIDQDHTAKLQKLVEAIDEDHTAKLQKLIESIDEDHTNKLQKVLKKIDESHTEMLQQVISRYQTELKESAAGFQGRMIDEVSSYLDLYLEKIVPKEQISEAVVNIQAKKALDTIRQIVSVDESYMDGEVKEALIDGKKIIDSLKKELNEAVSVNTELNHKLNEVESNLLLEQKTKELPASTRGYVTKLLKGRSPEYIQENFQYVVEMHERELSDRVETAKEKSVPRRIVESTDRPLVNEHLENEIVSPRDEERSSPVGEYLNVMKRGDKSPLYRA